MSGLDWLVPLMVCPVCRAPVALRTDLDASNGLIVHEHAGCQEQFPVINGIPRMLVGQSRTELVRHWAPWFRGNGARARLAESWSRSRSSEARDAVVAGFDDEWSRFSAVGTPESRKLAGMYFDLMPATAFSDGTIALDAGCGAGRWALEVASRGPRVIALDLGRSVEIAVRNCAATGRVVGIQADVTRIPLRDASVDWAYSLGVVHHVADTAAAVREIVRTVRPTGTALLYVYYALDGRGLWYRSLFALIDVVRRVVSRLPRPLAGLIAMVTAITVYYPLARTAALAHRLHLSGLRDAIPLSFYRDLPFSIMRNDSLDRLGTRVEKRFSRREVVELLVASGLSDVQVSPGAPFWHAVGIKGG